ncbi:MAG: DUF3782 domain-containing protein, partial [Caldilineales bacterium]|nr:DUF3782 domain-containing protein [Caldilineales bacterium]
MIYIMDAVIDLSIDRQEVRMPHLTNEEVIELFEYQLPSLLDAYPQLEPRLYLAFLKAFARKEEVAELRAELQEFRVETKDRFDQIDQRFEQVDRRFEQVDQRFEQIDRRFEQVDQRFDKLESRMEAGFADLHKAIDRLGSRWGIRNESLFRQTIQELLGKSFGVQVQSRVLDGEQFDIVICDGQHILVEIAASAGSDMLERLKRKRKLYTAKTGVEPTRIILAVASIHSRRAQLLRDAGIDVVEPEEETSI